MRVLMVLEAEFPPDERVEKEIKTLMETGMEVSIAVYTRRGRPETEKLNGYTIFRKNISPLLYKSSIAILIHPFYFCFWFKFLSGILSAKKFDAIHIHDLPLAKVGFKLARKYKLKFVCDQHEFYSNWIVRTRHLNTLTGKLIRLFSNWKKYEKKYLRKADLVITVEDPLKKIYIEQVGVNPEKILTLPNTPSFAMFQAQKADKEIIERFSGRFVLFYAGGLDHLRGIDFIMEAVAQLKNDIKELLFVLAGKENRAFSMDELISKYHAEEVTEFIGWVPLTQLSSYIAASNVCLFVPKADNLEINNTIATKIYQYASMGKPVIVSEARKMKDFVESNKIGFSVKYGNVNELCSIIRKLHDDPSIAPTIRSKAVEIAGRYTWEKTSNDFIDYYTRMIS